MNHPFGRVAALIAALAAALACGHEANAGGSFIPPHGARAMGQAGAVVAGEPDMNALWYNPALLAGIEGHHAMVDATVLSQRVTFERAPRTLPNGDTRLYAPVETSAPPTVIPQLGYASDFGLDRVVFGFGAFAPNGSSSRYPEDGAQRYTLISNEGTFLLTLEAAIAAQINDWLWIGGGFQNVMVQLRLVNVSSGFPGTVGDPEDTDFDILQETAMSSFFNPSANMGLWARPIDELQLGLGLQLPVHIEDTDAQVKVRLPSSALFDNAEVKGSTVEGAFDLPLILRAGARFVQPRWDIELDVVIEFWSIFDEIATTPRDLEIEGVPGVGAIEVGPLNIPRDYEDALSLRLGGSYQLVPDQITVRGGMLWEQSAIPTKTLSVLTVDMDKLGFSLGGSYQINEHVGLDLGYTHLLYFSEDVTDSIVEQLNPTNVDGAIVTGNGRYEAAVDMVSLGARFDF